MTIQDDPAAEALDEVAAAADRAASEQREVAKRARTLSRSRRRGASSEELVAAGAVTAVIMAIRASARGTLSAARNLQAALARALAREGRTTRQIGEQLGVSHQHVSALRRHRGAKDES